MKGFAITTILAIGGVLLLVSLMFSFFSGGTTSMGLFGWQGTVLGGVENFFTSIYNIMVVISSWATIGVLGVIFIGLQGIFVYFYYKLYIIARTFVPTINRVINELTGF